jgi:hypothetical protein
MQKSPAHPGWTFTYSLFTLHYSLRTGRLADVRIVMQETGNTGQLCQNVVKYVVSQIQEMTL